MPTNDRIEALGEELRHMRTYLLDKLNHHRHTLWHRRVSDVTRRLVEEHGPEICVDPAPFKALTKDEMPNVEGDRWWSAILQECPDEVTVLGLLGAWLFAEKEFEAARSREI